MKNLKWDVCIIEFNDGLELRSSCDETEFIEAYIQERLAEGHKVNSITLQNIIYQTHNLFITILGNQFGQPTHFETIRYNNEGNSIYKKDPIIYN